MKIKSNIRAGQGGATGAGKNRSSSVDSTSVDTVPVYVPPVGRCVGI